MPVTLEDISIRTTLLPGDIGTVVMLHGKLYSEEYQYGISFESYVAGGLHEFYQHYDEFADRVWICEHGDRIIGFLLLMHRPNQTAQLRYFFLLPGYRGIGLGRKLMELFMQFLMEKNYLGAYLWTTNEQQAAADLYKKFGFVLTEEKDSDGFGKWLIEQKYEFTVSVS